MRALSWRPVIDQTDPAALIGQGVRAVTHGRDLEAKLQALAGHARSASGATSCLIYLVDAASGGLLPAAWDGPAGDTGKGVEPIDDNERAELRAARERRVETEDVGGGGRRIHLPLVTEDAAGGQEVQGVLSAELPRAGSESGPGSQVVLEAFADLAALAIRVARLETALAERSDWYERVSQTDPLTGLANRRTFDRVLELELARAGRQGTTLSVAIFDVDGIERISATHGGGAGDDVLRRVASVLADSVRLVDTVGRYGGDEFALVAPGAAGRTVAERVVKGVASVEVEPVGKISLSAGVARFPEQGTTADDLLAAADVALRAAKQQGGGVAEAG
jgi:diguanylate cyclase (GGDEF)-like protein